MKNRLLLLLFLPTFLFAQDKRTGKREGSRPQFTVVGQVSDSLSQQVLSYAAVSFISERTDKLVTGGISDEMGVFTIEKVPAGSYKLLLEYLGYAPLIVDNVKVMVDKDAQVDGVSGSTSSVKEAPMLDLGVFYLTISVEQLQEVELIEEKPYVVQGIDRKIFNVDQDITSSGGTAIELMEKLPSVQVDMDGNISLRGSDQVRLYVDGKPSMLSSSELLETMPSSMIESIELITNPSAKYSPEGMAGIINIVLKKNKKAGFNGNVSASYGFPNRKNFTALVNRRSEKLNIFGSYSYMDREGAVESTSEKHTYFTEDTFHLYQEKWGVNTRKSHTFKGGLDYSPNETTSISLQAKYTPSIRTNLDTVHYNGTTIDGPFEYDRISNGDTNREHMSVDLSAKKDWENGLHLDFTLNKSHNTNDKENTYKERIPLDVEPIGRALNLDQLLTNMRYDDQLESKVDFSYGTEDDGKWEWGIGTRVRKIDQDQYSETDSLLTGEFSPDLGLNNHFVFEDQVHSAYATYAKSIGVWSFQAGLRAEQVYTESNLEFLALDTLTNISERRDSLNTTNYFEMYPSLHLTYSLDESTSIQASYTRRVNRPGFWALNPFPEYSDPYNLRMGNPYLKPEFINAFEIGYQKFAKGTSFSASVYAKDVNNMMRRFITVDENNVSTVRRENLNGSFDIGLEFMWSKQLTEAFNFMVSSNVYHSKMDASNLTDEYDESTFGMWSSFNAGWKNKSGHKVQVSGWVSPGTEVGQGRMKTMFSTDLAYSRPVFSDKGKLTLKISDLFNTRGFGIDTYGAMFDQSFEYKRQSQFFTMSLSYNFGDQNNRQQRRGGSRDMEGGDMGGGFF